MSTITDGVNSFALSPAFTVDLPIRPNPTTATFDIQAPLLRASAHRAGAARRLVLPRLSVTSSANPAADGRPVTYGPEGTARRGTGPDPVWGRVRILKRWAKPSS